MSNRNILKKQIYLYTIIFMAMAMTNTQVIPFLTSIGYSPVERGIILSSISVIAIIGQMFVGYLCDKYNSIKKFYHLLLFSFILLNAIMYSYSENNFFIHLLLFAFVGGLFRIVAGLVETWTLEVNDYIKDRFGPIRAFGAIGWAIGAPLTSLLIENYGYRTIGFSFAILAFFSMIFSIAMPDADKVESKKMLRISDVKQLLSNRTYVLLVFILIFVNFVFTADMYTVIDKMIFLGASNNQIAFKWSFQAVVELPLFFFGYLLLKKIGAMKMLIISISMFIIRFSLYTLATSATQIILITSLQSITFPLLMISQKVLVANESPEHLKSTGQMLAISLYGGLSALLTPVVSGLLINTVGFDYTLLIFTSILFIPLMLSFIYSKINRFT